jgi:hypothetical protein
MAKEMQLVDSYMYNGTVYGPGTVTPPDEAFTKAVKPKEQALIARLTEEGRASAALLPSGHPYHILLGVMAAQPPAYEGQATATPLPPVITSAETALLEQQGVDSGVSVPEATMDTSTLSTTGSATSAPGTPRSSRVVVRESDASGT